MFDCKQFDCKQYNGMSSSCVAIYKAVARALITPTTLFLLDRVETLTAEYLRAVLFLPSFPCRLTVQRGRIGDVSQSLMRGEMNQLCCTWSICLNVHL